MRDDLVTQLQQRTLRLERQLRAFRYLFLVLLLSLGVAAFASLPAPGLVQQDGVLRVRGIIIEDAAGRERILIGAPIPHAPHRVRTNIDRVRAAWGGRMPREYVEWYASYRHDMHGMVVLDEQGFDRIMIGDSVPDPNIGKRIAASTGIIINDHEGFERSGYGLMYPGGVGRVVLGLDSDDGQEGVILALSDDGFAGLLVKDQRKELVLGTAPGKHMLSGIEDPFLGLILRDGRTVKHQLNGAVEP